MARFFIIFSSPSLRKGSEERKNNLKVNVVCIIFHSKRKKKYLKLSAKNENKQFSALIRDTRRVGLNRSNLFFLI